MRYDVVGGQGVGDHSLDGAREVARMIRERAGKCVCVCVDV